MSNSYSQPWDQPHLLYGGQQNPQLDQNFKADSYPEHGQTQDQSQRKQQQQQQQLPQYQGPYHYQQQQAPSMSNHLHSSSLQGALQTNQASSHSRSSSYNGHSSLTPTSPYTGNSTGGYGMRTSPVTQATSAAALSYRNTGTFAFGATNLPPPSLSMPSASDNSISGGAYMAPDASSRPDQQQSRYYQSNPSQRQQQTKPTVAGPPNAKRARPSAIDEAKAEDGDSKPEMDSKDPNKVKPARACARCKNLKVRCEAKTENEPCKRCMNGGHECFIPGRKIRRVPPKREHLINQIQSQAKEIERLMKQLEAVTGNKMEGSSQGDDTRQTTPSSPVLSHATSESFLEPPENHNVPIHTTSSGIMRSGPATNKAIEDWIAKTRENMQELNYICVGEAGVPESYIVDEDLEDSNSSSDDEFVDVSEELQNDGDAQYDGDRYLVAIQGPEGGLLGPGDSRAVRHKLSASSMGTTKSAGTQNTGGGRKRGDQHKPANLPVEAAPFGLFGNMSLKARPRSRAPSEMDDEEEDKGAGIANQNFFRPAESVARQMQSQPIHHQAPAILAKGLITPAEAEILFQIYYAEMNLSVSLLDPVLYDAKRTFWRSPFLFTVICGIASRFYEERPELYLELMRYAQLAAGNALISGTKNVEMCAAYILLSLYPIPAKKWEHQRSWLYLGLAIRTATDLNLHLPMTAKPKNENHAREMLNRTRIWLNCFNLDRSTGSQYGKPPIISSFDYTANHSEGWWASSPQNLGHFDVHICAYTAELKLMSEFMAKIYSDPHHPTGLNKDVDFEALATQADDELQQLKAKWFSILDKTDMSHPENCFRTGLLRLAYSYARLIALSYGFQHAFGKNDGQDENPFLLRCLSAATDVVNAVVKDVPRTMRHYFRHGPEAQSVFVTFASAFLVKLLQPKFASYLTREQRVEIRNLVQQVIDLLAEVSLDDRHGPKLYSRFLKGLLAKPLAKLDPSAPDVPSTGSPTRARSRRPKPTQTGSGGTTGSIDSTTFTTSSQFGGGFYAGNNQAGSPAASSPSPPPAESIASFDNFRPIGGIDPYAPDDLAAYAMNDSNTSHSGLGGGVGGFGGAGFGGVGGVDTLMADYLRPELPFDEEIVRSIQDLSDPTGWQDISMPHGFNWMTQFQQNMGLDLRSAASSAMGDLHNPQNIQHNNNNNMNMYDDTNMNYLTGHR